MSRLNRRRQPIAAEPVTAPDSRPHSVWPADIDDPEDWRVPVAFVCLAAVLFMAAVAVLVAT